VSVRYADIDISGSPFYAEVIDPNQVWVSSIPQTAVRDQPVNFDGQDNYSHLCWNMDSEHVVFGVVMHAKKAFENLYSP